MKQPDNSAKIRAEASGNLQSEKPEVVSAPKDPGRLTITVVFNNISNNDNLKSAWGFAAWIEDNEGAVLFDSGSDGNILLDNITAAGLDLTRLHTMVISHEHWDHVNGLPVITSKLRRQLSVFVPAGIEQKIRDLIPGADIIPVTAPQCITGSIWTTGPLTASHKGDKLFEQALLISKEGKSYIITGCSHPGIEQVVAEAKNHFPGNEIALVAGGFHMDGQSEQDIRKVIEKLSAMNVRHVAPSHCTGEKAIKLFSETWKDDFIQLSLGESYTTE